MKTLLISLILLISAYSYANCGNTPAKVDTDYVYAEVFSRGHMDLELIAVNKSSSRWNTIKIVSGNRFSLPTCEVPIRSTVPFNGNVATEWTSGASTSFSAAYAICVVDYSGKLIESHAICNWETGD